MAKNVFVFSSFTGVPDFFFQGYCFSGSDYIYEQEGASQYIAATGRMLQFGEDGCYCLAYRTNGASYIGADYSGYKKLFLYNNAGIWAVSNSLLSLAKHLFRNGVRLQPNAAQIAALGLDNGANAFTKQVSCFSTVYLGVLLVPSWCAIRIEDDRVETYDIRTPSVYVDYGFLRDLCGFQVTVGGWRRRGGHYMLWSSAS